jgi:16S rRNA processing protein RimM
VGAHGIKGEVKVEPTTEFAERFFPGSKLRVGDAVLTIASSRPASGRLLLSFEEVSDRNGAEKLQWQSLLANEPLEHRLGPDKFLSSDLVGLDVFEVSGTFLGKVSEVLPFPAHDVLAVGEILIPAVKEFVRSVDLRAGRMTVALIEGMAPAPDREGEAPADPPN